MLSVQNLSKGFSLYKSPSNRFLEILLRHSRHKFLWALKDISFEIPAGHTLGIIGANGAGKSTLLKILLGILIPDAGSVQINGRITGLLELGTGFNPEISGLENIRANGILLGMNDKEISQKLDKIVEFSEVGDFINEPLKFFSSGMIMRLAFSVAINANPNYFIIDEALAVGDAYFQQKCIREINKFREKGGSIVFVSHDMNAVKLLCDQVIVLEKGEILFNGKAEEATKVYNRTLAKVGSDEIKNEKNIKSGEFGTRRAVLSECTFNGLQSGIDRVSAGEEVEIKCVVSCKERIENLVIGFIIRDRFGQDLFGTNSYLKGVKLPSKPNESYVATWRFLMNLGPGKYTLTTALHIGPDHTVECLHWKDATIQFEVAGVVGDNFTGLCRLTPSLEINRNKKNG